MTVVHAEQAVPLSGSLQQRQAGCLPLLGLCAATPGPLCTCEAPKLDVSDGTETYYLLTLCGGLTCTAGSVPSHSLQQQCQSH